MEYFTSGPARSHHPSRHLVLGSPKKPASVENRELSDRVVPQEDSFESSPTVEQPSSGAHGSKGPELLPTTRAVASSQAGALAPSLAEQLEQLPAEFYFKKRLYFPWSDPHKALTPKEAAEHFEADSSRLRVDYGQGKKRLRGSQNLGVLEAQLTGSSKRPLDQKSQSLLKYEPWDPQSHARLDPFDAALELERRRGRVVLMKEGRPLGSLRRGQEQPDLNDYATLSTKTSLEKAADSLSLLRENFGRLSPEIIQAGALSEQEGEAAVSLLGKLPDRQIPERLLALSGSADLKASREALEPLGWSLAQIPSDFLEAAHSVHLKHGCGADFFTAFHGLTRSYRERPERCYQDLAADPQATLIAVLPSHEPMVKQLFAEEPRSEAMLASARLAFVEQLELAAKYPGRRLASCIDILSAGYSDISRELALKTFDELVTQGTPEPEAQEEVVELLQALRDDHQTRTFGQEARHFEATLQLTRNGHTPEQSVAAANKLLRACRAQQRQPDWRFEYFVGDRLAFYQNHLVQTGRDSLRQLYVDFVASGNPREEVILKLLEPAGTLSLDERVESYRQFSKHGFAFPRYRVARWHLQNQESQESSLQESRRFVEAYQRGGWSSRGESVLTTYRDHLIGADKAPVRELYLEAIGDGNHDFDSVPEVLKPLGSLDLEERVDLYRHALDEPFTQEHFQTTTIFIKNGHPPDQSVTAANELFRACRSQKRRLDWRYDSFVRDRLAFYQNHLVQTGRESLRQLYLDFVASGNLREEVILKLLEPAGTLSLDERVESYRQFSKHGFAFPRYRVARWHLQNQESQESSLQESRRFIEAYQRGGWSSRGESVLTTYRDHLIGADKAPVRELYLEAIGDGNHDFDSVPEVLKPLGSLDLEERVDLYRHALDEPFTQEHFQTTTIFIKNGHTPDQSVTAANELFRACISQKRRLDWRYDSFVGDRLAFYQNHLVQTGRDSLRQLYLDFVASGNLREEVILKLLEPAGTLSLDERVESYRQFSKHGFAFPRYRVARWHLQNQESQESSLQESRRFVEAYQRGGWSSRGESVLITYRDHLIGADKAPVRELYLEAIGDGNHDFDSVPEVLKPLGSLDLEERVDLYRHALDEPFTRERYETASQLVKKGHTSRESLEVTEEFFRACGNRKRRMEDWRYESFVNEQHALFQQIIEDGPAGLYLARRFLRAGDDFRSLSALRGLSEPLRAISRLELDPQTVTASLDTIELNLETLAGQVQSAAEVLSLAAETRAVSELDVKVTDEEVVVGGFVLERQN